MACLESLFLLATLTLSASGKALDPRDLPVTCEAPAVNAGDIGRVTYHLNRDVTEIPFPVSLSVEFYPDKQNGSVLLAKCNWTRPGDTECWVKRPAHRFLVKESGNMVLEIPKVTTEDTGRYVCQQMSDSHRSDLTPKPCFLFVNDSLVVHEPANTSPGAGDPVTDATTGSEEPPGHRGEKYLQVEASESVHVTIIIPAVIIVTVVAAAAVLALVLIRKRRRMHGVHGSESRQSAEESLEETAPLSTNPEDPGDERKSSQPTPENAALLPSGSSDAACGSIQEEGGELDHRDGGAGGGDSSESQGEEPLREIAAISAGKRLANKILMAKKEYPYGPRK